MNRRNAFALLASSLGLAGCWGGNGWNQKLTVTLMTPNGEVSGSAVTRVDFTLREDSLWMTTGYAYGAKFSGEAAVVEVAPGKYLFALLEEKQKLLAIKVIAGDKAAGQPTKADLEKVETHLGAVALDRSDYPLLVTFTDITDPTSVKEVKPENLAATFGQGYALRSITLEITDEDVTQGKILQLLPWIGSFRGRIKPIREPIPNGYKPTTEEQLYSHSFTKGF